MYEKYIIRDKFANWPQQYAMNFYDHGCLRLLYFVFVCIRNWTSILKKAYIYCVLL